MQSYDRPTCKHAQSHVAIGKHQRRHSHYTKYSWRICRRLWTIYHTTYRHDKVDTLHVPKQKRTRCIKTLSAIEGTYFWDESRRNAMEISPPIPRNDIFWDTLVQIEEPCKIHLSKKRRHTRISNRFLDSQNLPTIVSDGKCRRVCCNVRSSASTTVSFDSPTFTPTPHKDTLAHLHVLNWPRKCKWRGWKSLSA